MYETDIAAFKDRVLLEQKMNLNLDDMLENIRNSDEVIVLSDGTESCKSSELEYVPLKDRIKPPATTTNLKNPVASSSGYNSRGSPMQYTFSDSDDDDLPNFGHNFCSEVNKLMETDIVSSPGKDTNVNMSLDSDDDLPIIDLPKFDKPMSISSPVKKKKAIAAESRDEKKLEKERLKLLKETEKERQKKLKDAEKEMLKISKPGECLKTIKALIDLNLLEMKGASDLLNVFQTENVEYSLEQQPLKNCVTWQREKIEEAVLNSSKVELKKNVHLENCVLVVIESNDFVNQVDAEIKQGFEESCPDNESLWGFVKKVKKVYKDMEATFVVYGMDAYYKKNKIKENRNFRVNLTGQVSPPKRKRTTKKAAELALVTRFNVEEAITKIQLLESVNFRSVETISEIGEIIFMFTKSMGEKYLRKNKDQDDDFDSYLLDGMFAVKVDKDGKGLLKAWEQQLMTFHQVSSDVAQAIIKKYPSPLSLIKAYENCDNQGQCQRLLENIEVRRGYGPLNTTRRVGPELSNKVYLFLTSTNGNTALYT